MDTIVAVWILDFILRQPFIDDSTLTSLITSLPLPSDNLKLSKKLLIRRIQSEVAKGSVSENILDLLELVEELDHVTGVPATEAIKRAYCLVAVDCTVRTIKDAAEYIEMVKRVWRDRLGKMGDCGLVSDELFGWRDLVEAAVLDLGACESLRVRWRENDTMGAVRAYVEEAWEGLGPSFLEVVGRTVASDAAVREVLGVASRIFEIREEEIVSEGDKATTANDKREVLPSAFNQGLHQHLITDNVNNVVSQKGTILPRRKHVIMKRTRGSVAGTSRGAKITDTEQVDNRDLSSRYGCLPSPAISKVQEALKASSFELQAAVKDPLPEALQFAGNAISSKNTDSRNLEVEENDADPYKPCTNQQNNASKPSLMTRNCTARAYEWDDSIESLPEGGADSRSTIKLPSPKNIVVSPLKKHEMKNLTRRRKPKKWSTLEEETLRTGVEKYGRGCWKAILNSYCDIFEDRTYVDLKDKWRIMTRYTN